MPSLQQQRSGQEQEQRDKQHNIGSTSGSTPSPSPPTRIVLLLLDLDCFYASCECLRLGLDPSTTALAVLQWNSVLAVTYPARKRYGIQRGDSWETVQAKSSGQKDPDGQPQTAQGAGAETGGCLAVHVPILTVADANNATRTDEGPSQRPATASSTTTTTEEQKAAAAETTTTDSTPTLQEDYRQIYEQSDAQKQALRDSEIGLRRFAHEGKACIERYRTASARVFEVVKECLRSGEKKEGLKKVVLERASIDEFFLDVTVACQDPAFDALFGNAETAWNETIITGSSKGEKSLGPTALGSDSAAAASGSLNVSDDKNLVAFQRGCVIAHFIRSTVHERLGFTMSAGISLNKTLAKLSASYGKPNGQAVTLPCSVEHVLGETAIGSCRNLGGKLGARVQALLPKGCTNTVGDVAKYLSLDVLHRGLNGDLETAQWVYQIARGHDAEPVVSKTDAAILTKSITAFKALPRNGPKDQHSVEKAAPWIRLLAQEVVERVGRDASRNSRYPRTCTVQYAAGGTSKSIRMAFPNEAWTRDRKIDHLCQQVPVLIAGKEGNGFALQRVGLCAQNFLVRETRNAINKYFSKKEPALDDADGTTSMTAETNESHNDSSHESEDLEVAKALQARYDREDELVSSHARAESSRNVERETKLEVPSQTTTSSSVVDADLHLAEKLQASFDRENEMLQRLDKKRLTTTSRRPPKTRRIESFFTAK